MSTNRKSSAVATTATLSAAQKDELATLARDVAASMRRTCEKALHIGLRLMCIYQHSDISFRDAIDQLESLEVPRSTAQRWTNAAAAVLMRRQGIDDATHLEVPRWDSGKAFHAAEEAMTEISKTTSLRRILLGTAGENSDERRLEELIEREEQGDAHATEALAAVASGKMTLIQAMRAAAGAAATKGKSRNDPIYLAIDGRTGEIRGLFPQAAMTLRNAFARWEHLDEPARKKARSVWHELVANLPSELA